MHLGHFFRALVNQQNDDVALGVVADNGIGHVLQHQRLTGFRRCDDQAALTFTDRCAQIDDAASQILGGAVARFQNQALVREQRRQVFEQDLVFGLLGAGEVNIADLEQGEVALAFFGRANLAGDGVACAQIEATNLAGRYIDVVGASEIGTVCTAQKAKSVLEDFQYAVAVDVLATFRVTLQNRENDVLFAGAGDIIQANLVGNL